MMTYEYEWITPERGEAAPHPDIKPVPMWRGLGRKVKRGTREAGFAFVRAVGRGRNVVVYVPVYHVDDTEPVTPKVLCEE